MSRMLIFYIYPFFIFSFVLSQTVWTDANGDGLLDEPKSPSDAQGGPDTSTECKLNMLVQCLSEPLDEWAMVLYSIRENIAAITRDNCNTSRDLIRRCVEEKAIYEYNCDQDTVLAVAARVTDLLMHKKNSGNLLRSYYVTAYVCSEEGQAVRNRIGHECLSQQHIGQMTFEAMKYLDERLGVNSVASAGERCVLLRDRAHLMKSIGNHKCPSREPVDAGILMCETLKMAFLKMYPATFGDGACDFACRDDQNDHPREPGSGRRTTAYEVAPSKVIVDTENNAGTGKQINLIRIIVGTILAFIVCL